MALVYVLLLISITLSSITLNIVDAFDVIQYGAIGDGRHDDSQAFLKAWNDACGTPEGTPTLSVPAGKTFFLKPLVFAGPCRSPTVRVQIDGNLVAPGSKGAWANCYGNGWITFNHVDGLDIEGAGTLDAKGSSWWDGTPPGTPPPGVCSKPTTIQLNDCNNAALRGVHFLNSGRNHISINTCVDLSISSITITAPENSPNTDGIDIINSRSIRISDSQIGTGDDCIAINNNVMDVNISGITCGPGHGISIGSLGRNGESAAVERINVEHCTFIRTMNSARIKTIPGGSGYARHIYYQHLTLDNVQSTVEINQHYPHNPEQSNAVLVSDVHFIDVQGTGRKILVDCSEHVPCQQIYLQDVNIAPSIGGGPVTTTCNHANLKVISVTPPLHCTR